MDVDDIRRKRMRLFTPSAAEPEPEQEALTNLNDGDFLNPDAQLAKQLQAEYDAGWDKAGSAAYGPSFAPPPELQHAYPPHQHQPVTAPQDPPFIPPPPPGPAQYMTFGSGHQYPHILAKPPNMTSPASAGSLDTQPGRRHKRSTPSQDTPPPTPPSLARDADLSDEANAVRTLVADIRNIRCGFCGSGKMGTDLDFEKLARDVQKQLGMCQRKATAISALQDMADAKDLLPQVRLSLSCTECDTKGNCLGCGMPHGNMQYNVVHVDGLEFTWHCDRERAALIWLLLCGYDTLVKHNKPQAPKPIPKQQSGRRGHSSGVGYGGGGDDGFGSSSVEDDFDDEDYTEMDMETLNFVALQAKNAKESKGKPKKSGSKFATMMSSVFGPGKSQAMPKKEKSYSFGDAGHSLSGPPASPPQPPFAPHLSNASLPPPPGIPQSHYPMPPPPPGVANGSHLVSVTPPPPPAFNLNGPKYTLAGPPGHYSGWSPADVYPPPFSPAFSGTGHTLSGQSAAGQWVGTAANKPFKAVIDGYEGGTEGQLFDHDEDEDEMKEDAAFLASLPGRANGTKKPSVSPPRENPDDVLTARIMAALTLLLPSLEDGGKSAFDSMPPSEALTSMLLRSSILDRAAELLRNESLEDVTRRGGLYESVLGFVKVLAGHYPTSRHTVYAKRLINQAGHDLLKVSTGQPTRMKSEAIELSQPLSACMTGLHTQSNLMLVNAVRNPEAFATEEMQNTLWLCRSVVELAEFMMVTAMNQGKSSALSVGSEASVGNKLSQVDKNAWQKDISVLAISDETILANHHYAPQARQMGDTATGRMAKLMKEITSLTTGLPPGIFVRYGESRMDVMKILIVGPQGTPYEGGLWEFDLLCPADYPISSPKMNFRTTGGGVARVNPNLYNDGKVCLSLLGTWSGEPWRPGKSTLLQVLISIQAMVFCEEPHCNEPSYERDRGSRQSKDYNRRVYTMTVKHAMLEWLGVGRPSRDIRSTRRGGGRRLADSDQPAIQPTVKKNEVWEEVVEKHFVANESDIMETVCKWAKDKPPAPEVPNPRSSNTLPQPHHDQTSGFLGTGWAGKTLGGGDTPMYSHTPGLNSPLSQDNGPGVTFGHGAGAQSPIGTVGTYGGKKAGIPPIPHQMQQQKMTPLPPKSWSPLAPEASGSTGFAGKASFVSKTIGGGSTPLYSHTAMPGPSHDATQELQSSAAKDYAELPDSPPAPQQQATILPLGAEASHLDGPLSGSESSGLVEKLKAALKELEKNVPYAYYGH